MKLSVSNIAWPEPLDRKAFSLLRQRGISALELAPTRIWPQWEGATATAARRYRDHLAGEGFAVSSLQSILFGKPACTLFSSAASREDTLEHLKLCAELAAALGAESLVFGAPGNRKRGDLPELEARAVAIDFFHSAAEIFEAHYVYLCLEANPRQYGCDFLCASGEAATVVESVNSPGIRLHLDTACMTLSGEDMESAIRRNRAYLRHFHVSEPHLGSFSVPQVDHAAAAEALANQEYPHWVTLEMRTSESAIDELETAVRYLAQVYQASSTEQLLEAKCTPQ